MKRSIVTCDRCLKEAHKVHVVTLDDDKPLDVCEECFNLLKYWLGKSNVSTQGDRHRPREFRGPGWVEVCPHHVPCAGPCPTPSYRPTG